MKWNWQRSDWPRFTWGGARLRRAEEHFLLGAGMIAGAVIGDVLAGRTKGQAARSGLATALGTLFSIGLKLVVSGILFFYVIRETLRAM